MPVVASAVPPLSPRCTLAQPTSFLFSSSLLSSPTRSLLRNPPHSIFLSSSHSRLPSLPPQFLFHGLTPLYPLAHETKMRKANDFQLKALELEF